MLYHIVGPLLRLSVNLNFCIILGEGILVLLVETDLCLLLLHL